LASLCGRLYPCFQVYGIGFGTNTYMPGAKLPPICKLLSQLTHTHTHTYIYIYIYSFSVEVFTLKTLIVSLLIPFCGVDGRNRPWSTGLTTWSSVFDSRALKPPERAKQSRIGLSRNICNQLPTNGGRRRKPVVSQPLPWLASCSDDNVAFQSGMPYEGTNPCVHALRCSGLWLLSLLH
jgi:hypothetical protein